MKKLLCLLLALLCTAAYAEGYDLPRKLLPHEEAALPLDRALTMARQAVDRVPAQAIIRAELVQTASGAKNWMVTIFDAATLADAWCVTLSAANGQLLGLEAAEDGFFAETYAAWTAQKGRHELWSLEDKQLYDAVYAMLPSYGLPAKNDMSAQKALERALFVLGLQNASGYEVGYGYLMGGDGYNGVWEISLVYAGQVSYRVNLDAVTGEVYYMEPDEAGNG